MIEEKDAPGAGFNSESDVKSGTDEIIKTEEPKSVKKNLFKNTLDRLVSGLAEVFKDYPVTMVMILIAALFAAILVHVDYTDKMTNTYEKIMKFAFCMGAQGFVIEELFKKKLIAKIGSFVFAVLFSLVFVYIDFYEEDYLFGIEFERISDIWLRIWVVYGVIIFSLAIYHIYRRLDEDFEEYCTRSFLTIAGSYIIYGLFAIGLAVILYIFNELIFDTDDFMECSEVFLATGFISAMTIRSLTKAHEKPGKFCRVCVMYVLLPMLIIAFAIVYIYMIKIFVLNDVPSNSVFGILAGLFSVGLPIWTMGHDIGRDGNGFERAAFIVPYAFIPFILLQCWSLFLRIGQYGFTSQRYFGIVLIVFEILYFIIYIIGRINKKDIVFVLLFTLMLAAPVCMISPRVCYDDVVINSQLGRIKQIINSGELSDSDKKEISSAYYTIKNVSFRGKNALEKKLTEAEKTLIEEYRDSGYGSSHSRRVYLRDRQSISDIDISEYSRIYETGNIGWEYGVDKYNPYETSFETIAGSDQNSRYCTVDLTNLVKRALSQYDSDNEDSYELGSFRMLKVDNNTDLFIKEITMSFHEEEPDDVNVKMSGYLLER